MSSTTVKAKISWTDRALGQTDCPGISEIHEAGFVQGDFTLSNIVIDDDDNARLSISIDEDAQLGWEPQR